MRKAYVQQAEVQLGPDGDPAALGGAVTQALCGSWDHEPPCPLASHHTSTERTGSTVRVRTVFAVDPALEPEVRRRMEDALREGQLTGPSGAVTRWELLGTGPAVPYADEEAMAQRWAHG